LNCRISDIKHKEVVNIKNGNRLGSICDIEIDMESGQTQAIIVYGGLRFWGIFGRRDDIVILWEEVKVIGEDIVLVSHETDFYKPRKNFRFLKGITSDWD
jgi:YlmC/YmxH family sporulation protein